MGTVLMIMMNILQAEIKSAQALVGAILSPVWLPLLCVVSHRTITVFNSSDDTEDYIQRYHDSSSIDAHPVSKARKGTLSPL